MSVKIAAKVITLMIGVRQLTTLADEDGQDDTP
jgi:hypothetical protein